MQTSRELVDDAAETYVAYLLTAYGFEREEVGIPDAYQGRELDWFGDLNDALSTLDGYSEPEARQILVGRNPWVEGGGSLMSLLREGDAREVRRILRRY